MKLKLTNKQINDANRKLFYIVQNVIDTKRRPSDGKVIKRRTGRLRSDIKAFFVVKDEVLTFDLSVVDYYKYLDEDGRDGWDLTEAVMESKEMKDLIASLLSEGSMGAFSEEIKKLK